MDKKTIIILILTLIIIGGVAFVGYDSLKAKWYNQGANDALILINQQIINSLNRDGKLIINYPYENKTIPLTLIPQLENK
jgi:hypothetical protein